MATHFSIPAWGIPWTEKPSGLQSILSQRVELDLQHGIVGLAGALSLWGCPSPLRTWVSVSFVIGEWGISQSVPAKGRILSFRRCGSVYVCLLFEARRSILWRGGLVSKAWAQFCRCPVSARCSGWGPSWGLPRLPSSTSTCSSPTP